MSSRGWWRRLALAAGARVKVAGTFVVRGEGLPRRKFRIMAELEGMYRDELERLVSYAVDNEVRGFTGLKAVS